MVSCPQVSVLARGGPVHGHRHVQSQRHHRGHGGEPTPRHPRHEGLREHRRGLRVHTEVQFDQRIRRGHLFQRVCC